MGITKKNIQTIQNKRGQKNKTHSKIQEICELHEEGNEPLNRDTHIYSSSFFKLGNMYKDITIYINGLEKLVNKIDNLVIRENQNIHYFLYYDHSIENDPKFSQFKDKIIKKSFIKLIKYKCPEFMNGELHKGVFGTFVRMFPLFDPRYSNNIKTVIDIDFDEKTLFVLLNRIRTQIVNNKNDIIALSTIGGEWVYSNLNKSKYFDGTILANITFKGFSLDFNLIKNMLYKINRGDKTILNFFEKTIQNKYVQAYKNLNLNLNINNLFIFGIDEYFINNVVIDYCIKHNKKLGIIYRCDPNMNLYIQSTIKWHKENHANVIQFFKEFLNDKYSKNDTIKTHIDKSIKQISIENIRTKEDFDTKIHNLHKYYRLLIKYKNKLNINQEFFKNIEKYIKYKNGILYSDRIKNDNVAMLVDKNIQIQDYPFTQSV